MRTTSLRLLLFIILFSSCDYELDIDFDTPQEPETKFEIYGVITDKHTRKPIEGVLIQYGSGFWTSESTVTDSHGKYSFNVSGSGGLWLSIVGYFGNDAFIDAQQLNCSTTHANPCRKKADFALSRRPAMKITAKNINPYDEFDALEIALKTHLSSGFLTAGFHGKVDTTFVVIHNWAYSVETWKDSVFVHVTKNSIKARIRAHYVEVHPGDTLLYQIEY